MRFLLALLLFPSSALAVDVSYVPYTITAPGYYRLIYDLPYAYCSGAAITIASDDVILDLNGKNLAGSCGSSTQATGIQSYSRRSVTVKNGTMAGFLYAIWLDGSPSSGHVIDGVAITQGYYHGVRMVGDETRVSQSSVSNIGGSTLWGPGVTTITCGICVAGENAVIVSNTVSNVYPLYPLKESVGISDSATGPNSLVAGNTINNATVYARNYGVWIGNSGGVALDRNTVSNYNVGVAVSSPVGQSSYQGNSVSGATTKYVITSTSMVDAGGNN